MISNRTINLIVAKIAQAKWAYHLQEDNKK